MAVVAAIAEYRRKLRPQLSDVSNKRNCGLRVCMSHLQTSPDVELSVFVLSLLCWSSCASDEPAESSAPDIGDSFTEVLAQVAKT
jgi:hypothetical protein